VCEKICKKNKCEVVESGAEADHIHLLIDLHPDNNISQLIKSLKSETSKMVQDQFCDRYKQFYRHGTALWGRQKFIVSCGGAPLKIVQEYIKNQASPQH
jgi:putative transposase